LQKLAESCTLIIGNCNDQATRIVLFNEERLPMAASPPRKKRKPAAKSARNGGSKEAADFIAEHLIELARLARRHQLDTLGFLLDMGVMEAKDIARGKRKA
jgi:hypothetical protein